MSYISVKKKKKSNLRLRQEHEQKGANKQVIGQLLYKSER